MQMDDLLEWEQAMQFQYDLIIQNQSWDLVSFFIDKNSLPFEWVYKLKTFGDALPQYKDYIVTTYVGAWATYAHFSIHELHWLVLEGLPSQAQFATTRMHTPTPTLNHTWHKKHKSLNCS